MDLAWVDLRVLLCLLGLRLMARASKYIPGY